MPQGPLISLTSDLRSLSNTEFNTKEPFVKKDLPEYNEDGPRTTQLNARTDDIKRITKLLTSSKPGTKFLTNLGFLTATTQQGNLLKKALGTVGNTAKVIGATLAQVPVNGTGTHLIYGFNGFTYLKNPTDGDADGGNFKNFMKNNLGIGDTGGIKGAGNAINGQPIGSSNEQYDGLGGPSTFKPSAASLFYDGKNLTVSSKFDLRPGNDTFGGAVGATALGKELISGIGSGAKSIGNFLGIGKDSTNEESTSSNIPDAGDRDTGVKGYTGTTNVYKSIKNTTVTRDNKSRNFTFSKLESIQNTNKEFTPGLSEETKENSILLVNRNREGLSNELKESSTEKRQEDKQKRSISRSSNNSFYGGFEGFMSGYAGSFDKKEEDTSPEVPETSKGPNTYTREDGRKIIKAAQEVDSKTRAENSEKAANPNSEEADTIPFGNLINTKNTPTIDGRTNEKINTELEEHPSSELKEGTKKFQEKNLQDEEGNEKTKYLNKNALDDRKDPNSFISITDENVPDDKRQIPKPETDGTFTYDANNRLQGDKDISLSVDEQKNIKSNFTPKTKEQREKVANFKTAYVPRGGSKNYITDPLFIPTKRKMRDQSTPNANPVDYINKLAESASENVEAKKAQIIPFEFKVMEGNDTSNFIYFRAFLDSLSDNYKGDWNGTKYIGRAEDVYNYTGFSRDVSFAFKIAALSKDELEPLYKKINLLAGTTAPTYNSTGAFMRGTLTRVTIGDYLKETNGFVNSVGLSWDVAYPWEIDLEESGALKVPHILNVDIAFTPIHNFAPTTRGTYIG